MRWRRTDNLTDAVRPYFEWHRKLHPDFIQSDCDSIELTSEGIPLAFLELKPLDHLEGDVGPYLRSLAEKYVGPGKIGKFFRFLATRLPWCEFWIVAPDFRNGQKTFYVYDIQAPTLGWVARSEADYARDIAELHERAAA